MIEQRSEEWYAERLGHVTASEVDSVMAEGKGSAESTTRRNYLTRIVVERMTGMSGGSGFENDAIRWGIEKEPAARAWYCDQTETLATQLGFVKHPTIMWVGASPDSEVEEGKGGLEIKCPNTATHIRTLLKGMDSTYRKQVQCQMWVMGWEWVDYVSFDPRMPEHLQGFIQRVPRDQTLIDEMEKKVVQFLEEVDETIASLATVTIRR